MHTFCLRSIAKTLERFAPCWHERIAQMYTLVEQLSRHVGRQPRADCLGELLPRGSIASQARAGKRGRIEPQAAVTLVAPPPAARFLTVSALLLPPLRVRLPPLLLQPLLFVELLLPLLPAVLLPFGTIIFCGCRGHCCCCFACTRRIDRYTTWRRWRRAPRASCASARYTEGFLTLQA